MNFLAHLALADATAESLIGNLAGDFVKGRVDESLPEGIRRGIVEHRRIDSFTDTHPIAGTFRRIIAEEHGHYAKVIADMFFDHFLAAGFVDYHDESLSSFLARTFAIMDPHQDAMPGRLRNLYPRIRDGRWLESYRDIDGIHVALTNLSYRLSKRPHLEDATPLLRTTREPLQKLFAEFYPQLQEFARSLR
jgi:acyl carrier protein phosphodiesterase